MEKLSAKITSGKKTYTTKKSSAVAAHLGAPSRPVITSLKIVDGENEEDEKTLVIKWKKNKDYDADVKLDIDYDDTVGRQWIGTANGNETKFETRALPWGFEKSQFCIYITAYRESSTVRSKSKGYKYVPKSEEQ